MIHVFPPRPKSSHLIINAVCLSANELTREKSENKARISRSAFPRGCTISGGDAAALSGSRAVGTFNFPREIAGAPKLRRRIAVISFDRALTRFQVGANLVGATPNESKRSTVVSREERLSLPVYRTREEHDCAFTGIATSELVKPATRGNGSYDSFRLRSYSSVSPSR